MIEEVTGDLLRAPVDALVNPVNCEGVMGRGLALQFKAAFPDNFASYREACRRGEVRPGQMWTVDRGSEARPRWIVNFPTKRGWRSKSRMEDIEAGLEGLAGDVRRLGVSSLAIPPIGCGLGGLAWPEVRPRIVSAFAGLPEVRVLLFAPGEEPAVRRRGRAG